jgi:NO-binding membrane sensor protein with MHYT domain
MIEPDYSLLLVLASIIVSVMASFTGLVLTRGISTLAPTPRKFMIVMAAMALGGGIWSMHFVAMLAMHLPVEVDYDAVYTLGSMLIAILMAGIAFLILHFSGRGPRQLFLAGAILGNGIVVMHYTGMAGIRGVSPQFLPTGVLLGVLGATVMGCLAVHVSYSGRTNGRILRGAVMFGLTVVIVHFAAMHWTLFTPSEINLAAAPLVDHGTLALLVMLSAFVICGTFLLTASNFIFSGAATQTLDTAEAGFAAVPAVHSQGLSAPEVVGAMPLEPQKLPYERDKQTHFIGSDQIIAIRAEGHYTFLYTDDDKLFCPLAISVLEKRLLGGVFIKTHRSYLVNLHRISAFERRKDNGLCLFSGTKSLKAAPVSRAYVPVVREALGL